MAEQVEIDIVANDKTSGIIQGIFQGIGQQIANFAMQIPGAIMDFGANILNEAMEAQDGMAQLEAVIKSTGGAAGMTADELTKLADELSQVTRFSDDAIIGGENLLLTFTNIGEDVFPDVTKAMLDMSTAMNQDLKSSAIQLGKALNDPIEGISALTRVGVTFTDEQKNMIESLVKTGDVIGAQKIILEELNKEFGGSAEAAGQTFAGQLDILRNSLNNVKEGIGMALLPVLNELAEKYLPVIMPMIEEFGAKLAEWIPAIGPVIDRLMNVATAIWEFLQPAFEAIGEWWEANGTDMIFKATTFFDSLWVGANTAAIWIGQNLVPVFQSISDWWDENGDTIIAKAEELWGAITEASGEAAANIAKFVEESLPKLAGWFDENGGRIGELIGNTFDGISGKITILSDVFNMVLLPVLDDVMQTILDLGTLVLQVANGEWAAAWDTIGEVAQDQMNLMTDFFTGAMDVILKGFDTTFDEIADIVISKVDEVINSVTASIDDFINNVTASIDGLVNRLSSIRLDTKLADIPGIILGDTQSEEIAGARASGGSVSAGQSYLVGEQGAEIFRPSSSGTIIPNGGAGGNINVTLQYSPSVALGNQYEAENVLLPFILQGIRAAQANGLVPVGS